MKVSFKGLKFIDFNLYDGLFIKEDELGNYTVYAKGKNIPYEGIELTNPLKFSNRIKDFSEQDKLLEIVNYFLDSHSINKLGTNIILPYYMDTFEVAYAKNNFLAVKTFHGVEIMKLMSKKYLIDRKKFVSLNKDVNIYEFSFNDRMSSYSDCLFNSTRCIGFNLLVRNGEIYKPDEQFLRDFIYQKLKEQGVAAEFSCRRYYNIPSLENYVSVVPKVFCGDLVIKINCSIFENIAKEVVCEYNNNLEKESNIGKVLQLKMEGF